MDRPNSLCEEAMSLSQSSQGKLPLLWDFDRWDSGQSPRHLGLPTSQINTSLVFSAVWPQHHLPLPTPGLLDTEDFHWWTSPLVSHHCSTTPDSLCVLLLCHTNTCLLLLFALYACCVLLLRESVGWHHWVTEASLTAVAANPPKFNKAGVITHYWSQFYICHAHMPTHRRQFVVFTDNSPPPHIQQTLSKRFQSWDYIAI